MQLILNCPVCGHNTFEPRLSVKDYTVSTEIFDVVECTKCTLRFTQRVPDEAHIGKYYQSDDYISHTDSKKGLFNNVYQLVRGFALGSKRRLVEEFTKSQQKKMLDYGCGTGAFLHEMKLNGWDVSGIEPDPGAAKKAMELTASDVKSPSALDSFEPASFDAITLWHVLEHVHTLNETLEKLKLALKPGGFLFIAVPNYTSHDASYYQQHWAAYDVPRHLYHFSPAAMKTLVSSHGLTMTTILPMWFDSFYVSMLSEKYKNNNSSIVSAIIQGAISNIKALFNKEKCSSLIYVIRKG
jgi:2-polyprenyl-3-methyl-5-hydroxy-6-metoxy-1,4-benzoquinol methylase